MFGYIKTNRPELKVRDDEIYKGVYCTLCRAIGKRCGIIGRMFLSYDVTFMLIALTALRQECSPFVKMRCPFNIAKKCRRFKDITPDTAFCADVSVLLTYHKIRDNIHDSSFFKAILFSRLLLILTPSYIRAKKHAPDATEIIINYMDSQFKTEKNDKITLDSAADPTGRMLGELFTLGARLNEMKKETYRVGYLTGRWIYLTDAADDIEKDTKSGNFNPFLKCGITDRESIQNELFMTAGQLSEAVSHLKIYKFKSIIDNIINDGLYIQTQKILTGEK